MRHFNKALQFSATDLVNFLGCTHCTTLDLAQTGKGPRPVQEDEYLELLQEKGIAHEHAYLAKLRAEGRNVVEIAAEAEFSARHARTIDAMQNGADVIYQGALGVTPWHGYSDFLIRTNDYESKLGAYAYEVADTKLSHSAKPKHVLQLGVYSDLVANEQGVAPRMMHLVLGDGRMESFRVADFAHYCRTAQARLAAFVAPPPKETHADPNPHCGLCHWSETCEAEWERTEHLGLVANITRIQTRKLRNAGIATMRQVSTVVSGTVVPKMQTETLTRLAGQAELQIGKRDFGHNEVEVLPTEEFRGFARLPKPSEGDLFFDMEGDPLYDGGLEYLFGFDHVDDGVVKFTAFWAHDRAQEKKAFQDAVDFIVARLEKYPDAHIYHYASYEKTQLKDLAMTHGTREDEIDDLLRGRKLVDLYRVVVEGVRTSEPAYSLKNIEVFFAGKRGGDVKTAGDSIVMYERWRKLRDQKLLDDIAAYNEVDCHSTRACRDWLLTLRPEGVAWFEAVAANEAEKPETTDARKAREAEIEALQTKLVEGAPESERGWRTLLGFLLDFHRREAKPEYWAMYDRQLAPTEKLIDDAECIGGLVRDTTVPPYKVDRSMAYTFTFPEQDLKRGIGDEPLRSLTLEPAGTIVALDENTRRISLKIGPKRTPLPDTFSLLPPKPLPTDTMQGAIRRYAESVMAGSGQYSAITGVLAKDYPRVHGRARGTAIIDESADIIAATTAAIGALDQSHLLIQGPPGAGKTFTSAHAIVQLLADGKRIGVASMSHKAINNLLACVENVATKKGVSFCGVKKSSNEEQYLNGVGLIQDTTDNKEVENGAYALIAGTAWLFARPNLDQQLDYLFIDEAGQVSLANVVAMGVAAKNIVLIGDQQQLSQPIKGSHPGGSGVSALDHLLHEHATVPPERGVFLSRTWRMHPDLCQFISDAVYDSRLMPAPGNERQLLELPTGNADGALTPSGLKFVGVEHDTNTQDSQQEADRIRQAYDVLLKSHWTDRDGVRRAIGVGDILVVSPYNLQVNLLRRTLPSGARVGTVDRFQGQEAPVVLISMAASSGEEIPRSINFLFSRNRLNVAISRARCLAVVFASPRLLDVTCSTVEQMRLVNFLCWARSVSQ